MAMSKFTVKKYELEYLERMYRVLEGEKEDVGQTWGKLDEMEQDRNYNPETKKWEPAFNEDGTPKMVNKTGLLPKSEEDYTEDDRARLKAIENLTKKLEGMM